ncbi:MAG: phosphatidate cytidylyltransferase [Burkholderiaceae bacterium]
MLKQRVVTALILSLVAVGAMLWSPFAFAVVATAVMGLALAEWLRLAGASQALSIGLALVVSAALLASVLLTPNARAFVTSVVVPLSVLASAIWLLLAIVLVQPNVMAIKLPRPLGMALALVLVFAAWFALIRFLFDGMVMLLSVLFIVWIADTAAYFAGRAFGRRKLAPHISPGKTWAGVAGAVAAVLLTALIVQQLASDASIYSNRLFAANGGLLALLLLAWLVAMSVIGDLFESLLKRQAGVKDSGQLLPGHGGVLDRVDALVPVLPAAVLIQWLIR